MSVIRYSSSYLHIGTEFEEVATGAVKKVSVKDNVIEVESTVGHFRYTIVADGLKIIQEDNIPDLFNLDSYIFWDEDKKTKVTNNFVVVFPYVDYEPKGEHRTSLITLESKNKPLVKVEQLDKPVEIAVPNVPDVDETPPEPRFEFIDAPVGFVPLNLPSEFPDTFKAETGFSDEFGNITVENAPSQETPGE